MIYHIAYILLLASIISIAVVGLRLLQTTLYSASVPDEMLAGLLFNSVKEARDVGN